MAGYTYILANHPRGKLYVGVTNDLVRRVWEHRAGLADGYTKENNIKQLVHFDVHETGPLPFSARKISNIGYGLGRSR